MWRTPADFVRGIRACSRPDGTAIIEVPYLRDLLGKAEFDTIYHEHLCYFSRPRLAQVVRAPGAALNDVERIAIHGGSLRIFVQKHGAPSARLRAMLEEERRDGLDRRMRSAAFAGAWSLLRARTQGPARPARAEGKRIAGYGAAAKGTILLNISASAPRTCSGSPTGTRTSTAFTCRG